MSTCCTRHQTQDVNIKTIPRSGSGATLQIHASTSDATFWIRRPWEHAQRGVVLVLHGRMSTLGDEVEVRGRQEWGPHKALLSSLLLAKLQLAYNTVHPISSAHPNDLSSSSIRIIEPPPARYVVTHLHSISMSRCGVSKNPRKICNKRAGCDYNHLAPPTSTVVIRDYGNGIEQQDSYILASSTFQRCGIKLAAARQDFESVATAALKRRP